MKVSFRQSGGYVGMIRGVDLDTSKLDADQASELEGLVNASGIQSMKSARSQKSRDLQNYDITIEQHGKSSHLTFDDSIVTPEMQPLLKYLKAQAKPMPLDAARS